MLLLDAIESIAHGTLSRVSGSGILKSRLIATATTWK